MSVPTYVEAAEANAVLHALVSGVQGILGRQLVGLYLFGSLAVGDFDAASSDIDFVAVTEHELTDEQLRRLQAFHAQLFASGLPLAGQLEGAYFSRASVRAHDPANAQHPHIDRGEPTLKVKQLESDWVVQRYSLRHYGIVLTGPPTQSLIDPISASALRSAVLDVFNSWWAPMLNDMSLLEHNDGYQAYAVATFCRILYTLERGGLVSKPTAGHWAMHQLDPRFALLIQRALAYQLRQTDIPATREFLRYTRDRIHNAQPPLQEDNC